MIPRRNHTSSFVAALVLVASAAFACTIPVFRYALDRWQADPFALVIPQSLSGDKAVNDLLRPIRANSPGNLEVVVESDPAFDKPGLFFPGGRRHVWSGELTADSLKTLLDSPARQAVVKKILSGVSTIWILVDDGGDAGTAEAKRIGDRLKFLEQVASLPIQDPNDPDSQLGPGPELKLDFDLIRVNRTDPAEAAFVEMLRGPSPNPDTATQPFVAAVFGRGRALGAWTTGEMDNIALEDASMFLTGRCSCQVKQQNPGWDLMLSADWDKALQKVSLQKEIQESPPATDRPKATGVPASAPKKDAAAPNSSTNSKPNEKAKSATPKSKSVSQPAPDESTTEPVTVKTQPASPVTEIPVPKLDPLRISLFSFGAFCALVVLIKLIRPKPKAAAIPDEKP